MSGDNDRISDVDGEEAEEVLALRAEVARTRALVPVMREKLEATSGMLGGRRRRRSSSPWASGAVMSAAPPGRVK